MKQSDGDRPTLDFPDIMKLIELMNQQITDAKSPEQVS